MLKKCKTLFFCLIFIFVFDLVVFLFYPKTIINTLHFNIKSGTSLNQISQQLEKTGVLIRTTYFNLFAIVLGLDHKIQAGEYNFSNEVSIYTIFRTLTQGRVVQYEFTIIEGATINEIQKEINNTNKLLPMSDVKTSKTYKLGDISFETNEGLFLPDTYFFIKHDSGQVIFDQAFTYLIEFLNLEWNNRDKKVLYKNKYEALIMASIIEKETSSNKERSLVSSVFNNRLDKNMRLQSCSTVIYGIGDKFTGKITKSDLKQKNNYNTYRKKGLPISPICCPSRNAIKAALHPAKTDYLYFVVSPTGEHVFSKTYKTHLLAVKKLRQFEKQTNTSFSTTKEDNILLNTKGN